MSKQSVIQPWKATCELRPEIRDRKLTASDFAVDLYKVINGWPGEMPYYCDPLQFFSTTYATQNLRQFCKVVLRRLAKEPGGEAVINVAQTFGGGKSHTLTTLFYLTTLGKKLPRNETSVGTILNDAQLSDPPIARIAAVSFDKVDWVKGCEVASPSGEKRSFRMPWNLIAWQLLGQQGLDILARDEAKSDFDTPPADTLWAQVLSEVGASGRGALILIDEFLMWGRIPVTILAERASVSRMTLNKAEKGDPGVSLNLFGAFRACRTGTRCPKPFADLPLPRSPTQTVAGLATPPAPAWVAHDGSLPKPPTPHPSSCLVDPPIACTMIPATANRSARLPSGTDIEGRNRKAVEFPRTPASGRQSAVGLRRNGDAR